MFLLNCFFCAILLIILCFYVLWQRRKYYKLMLQLGGPIGYPLIGSALDFREPKSALYVFEKYIHTYGHMFMFWVGPRAFIMITDPQIIKDIFTSTLCINKLESYDVVEHCIGGPGLFTAKDALWSRHRKLLNPAFAHKILLSFLPIFEENVNVLLETVDCFVGKAPMDFTDALQTLTALVAYQTTTGVGLAQVRDVIGDSNQFIHSIRSVTDILARLIFAPWLKIKVFQRLAGIEKLWNELISYTQDIIARLIKIKMTSLESTDVNGNANEIKHPLINRALELQKTGDFNMSDVEIEIKTVFIAAFETTSVTLYNVLMLLSMYPQYQTKVFEELQSLYPEKGDFEVTYEDTQKMIFLEMVINETMRLFAPVPVVGRQTSAEVLLSNGVVLPKDIEMLVNIFQLQRRKDIWGVDAENFNPDHFLKSNMEGRHPYAFVPFTKGARICIGWRYALLSMKVTLAKLLRNYCFHTDFKFEDLKFVFSVTIKFEEIPLLSVTRRDS